MGIVSHVGNHGDLLPRTSGRHQKDRPTICVDTYALSGEGFLSPHYEDTSMHSRFIQLLQKLHHRTQIDPALKRAYPSLPSYLLKRHSALLSIALAGERHG